MEITIIGGFGGISPNRKCTSLLINNKLLIDAGAGAYGLNDDQKKNLEAIVISHTHLDHIRELPHLCRDLQFLGKKSIRIFCNKFTDESLRSHIFNGILFDNYIDGENKFIEMINLSQDTPLEFGEITIIPVKVNHPCDAYGYVVKEKDDLVFFTIDTGPSEKIWETVKNISGKLKAVFIDVSFPNSLQAIADLSGHHTPQSLASEISFIPAETVVYATHIKPFYLSEVSEELDNLMKPNLMVVNKDSLHVKI